MKKKYSYEDFVKLYDNKKGAAQKSKATPKDSTNDSKNSKSQTWNKDNSDLGDTLKS